MNTDEVFFRVECMIDADKLVTKKKQIDGCEGEVQIHIA